jgi:AcrR family transcriptional regulator
MQNCMASSQCIDAAIVVVNTVLYGGRHMADRLTAQDWVDFALKALARRGFGALKADVLARELGISRGSFYWHFPDLNTFHARVIDEWKQKATEAIIADIERHAGPDARLDTLLGHAFGRGGSLEIRMRTWAETSGEAALAVNAVDGRRREYIEQLLAQAGVAPAVAKARAQLLYWAYLGAALSRERLTGGRLDQTVGELKRVALGAPRANVAHITHGRPFRADRTSGVGAPASRNRKRSEWRASRRPRLKR